MADDQIKLGIVLEGIDKIASSIASLGGPFSKTMANIAESTKNATDVINMMTEAMERQKAVQAELGSAKNSSESGGGTSSAPPPSSGDQSSGGGGKLLDTKETEAQLTVIGNLVNGIAEAFRNMISASDFEAVQQAIKEKFAAPMEDGEKKTKKAHESVKSFGEGGVASIEKLSSATKHFAEALTEASTGSAIEGIKELASVLASTASGFGAAGAAAGEFLVAMVAVSAAIAGANAATLLLAEHAADSVIAMDNLGKSAGTSGAEIYSLQSAFDDLGASAAQFEQAIRSINNRLLSGWPQIKREVRDSADTMEAAYAKIAEAQENLNRVKRDGTLQDEKVREAQRGVNEAQRNIDASQDNKLKAELSYSEALDGRVRAQLRAAEAQRGIAAASRQYEQAQISLRSSLVSQKEAALDVVSAYRSVKEAQLGLSSAQTSLAMDRLNLQEALYKRGLERGTRYRDPFLEQRFARQRDNLELQALRDRVTGGELNVQQNADNVARKQIEARNAGDIKKQADINVGEALAAVAAAKDGIQAAAVTYSSAVREQTTANISVREASRALAAANEGIPDAQDKFAMAVESFRRAVEDANNQPAREAAAERELRAAQNAAQDKKNENIPLIAATLQASDQQRFQDAAQGKGQYVNLSDVSVDNLAQAIATIASPDGGVTKPNAEQVIFALADVLNKNKDSEDYGIIRSALSKMLSPRGDINAFLTAATESGAAGLKKKMDENRVTAEELYGEGPIRNSRKYEEEKNTALTKADEQAVRTGIALLPVAAEQFRLGGEAIGRMDFSGFADGLKKATEGVNSFVSSLDRVANFFGLSKEKSPSEGPGGPFAPGEKSAPKGPSSSSSVFGENGLGGAAMDMYKMFQYGRGAYSPTQQEIDKAWSATPDKQIEQAFANVAGQIVWAIEKGFSSSTQKRAGGGLINGPGSGTSDSIPAMVSNGEYIFTSQAVGRIGVATLDAMNYGKGYAMGGFVGTPRVGFANSSKSAMGHYSLDIRTNDGTFSATVDSDTMRAITKSAMGAKLKSSGVKPSWWK